MAELLGNALQRGLKVVFGNGQWNDLCSSVAHGAQQDTGVARGIDERDDRLADEEARQLPKPRQIRGVGHISDEQSRQAIRFTQRRNSRLEVDKLAVEAGLVADQQAEHAPLDSILTSNQRNIEGVHGNVLG